MKFHWFRRQQHEEEDDVEIHSHPDEHIHDRIARAKRRRNRARMPCVYSLGGKNKEAVKWLRVTRP